MDLQEVSDFLKQSMATTRRMVNVGAEIPAGSRVLLEHLHVGLKIITSRQAVERYLAAINGINLEATEAAEAPAARRTKKRQQDLDRVDRELNAAGL